MTKNLDQFRTTSVETVERADPNRELRIERIEVPGEHPFLNLFHPSGFDIGGILDPDHYPRITTFHTVIVSEAFDPLRGESPNGKHPAIEIGGEPEWLQIISEVAGDKRNYDKASRKQYRRMYTLAMANSLKRVFENEPIRSEDIIVPIIRCGDNIAKILGLQGIPIEIKRLRFKGFPDLLGAGIDLPYEVAKKLNGKRVRLSEGVVASGSTEDVLLAGIVNWGFLPKAVDCDAVVVTPAGARLSSKFRGAIGIPGEERGTFLGGILNSDWYVEYHHEDPLLGYLEEKATLFIGKPVLGDGGELTSNI